MQATILLVNPAYFADMMFSRNPTEDAKRLLSQGSYNESEPVEVDAVEADDIAEELFDLTNNPGRQDERIVKYGQGRSLSVGDIVKVGEARFLCMSCGWAPL